MAPRSVLPSDSPMGKDIKRIVREMLRDELSLEHWTSNNGSVVFQLKLGDKRIGTFLRLGIAWKQDHGHGGGTYVDGLILK